MTTTNPFAAHNTGGRIHVMDDHIHSPQKVYPTLANGVQLTGAAGAWTLGAIAEVVPANTITSPFDIHWLNVESASVADTFEVVIYQGPGASETEISRVRFTKSAAIDLQAGIPIQTAILVPNARISAACASASGGGDTITISLLYHTYAG